MEPQPAAPLSLFLAEWKDFLELIHAAPCSSFLSFYAAAIGGFLGAFKHQQMEKNEKDSWHLMEVSILSSFGLH